MGRRRNGIALLTATALVGGSTTACAGWGGGISSGGKDSINVLMVNNPQMMDLQKLAPDFEKETGIHVNFTVLPEDDLRDKTSQEFSAQAGQYDVATLSNFEIPIYAKAGWVADLTSHVKADTQFDQDDILAPMTKALSVDGKIYGEPFYGESSFLMYRKDILASKGITMPANPTWPQVADIAAKVDGATWWQRLTKVILPNMKAAIMVALLFRTLDAFRIFDNPYVMTGGANDTTSLSMLVSREAIDRVEIGMGSALAVILFLCVLIIAAIFVKGFKVDLAAGRNN